MPFRDYDIEKLFAKELRKVPFMKSFIEVAQKEVVSKVVDHVNQLRMIRNQSLDYSSRSVIATSSVEVIQLTDAIKKGSLLVMLQGSSLLIEQNPDSDESIVSLIDSVTLVSRGTVDRENGIITITGLSANTSNKVEIQVLYLTNYSMDASLLDELRKTLGFFIDTSGFQTEEGLHRLVEGLPFFYEVRHSPKFIDFLGYSANAPFDMQYLYAQANQYPNYGPLRTLREAEVISGGSSNIRWAHEVSLPTSEADYALLTPNVWYRTSFVRLEYDDEVFFKNVGAEVDLFQKITQLFYQLAPIQMVLESILAKRRRELPHRIRAGVILASHYKVNTDSASVAGVNP